mmetsp:Transcript_22315/g.43409  ORF Transcript_22315/g.43409 Transcript_22315/m.43409 type:complete len:191 (-) Transcript_22315:156-728(-)
MGTVVGSITEETPKFTVLARKGFYEVRKYVPGVAIETMDSDDRAFQRLAQYIGVFGEAQNMKKEKISMTAPVVNRQHAESKQLKCMQFLLPSKYTMDSAPIPMDQNIKLVEVPERILAVHTFSGVADERIARAILAELLAHMKKDSIQADEEQWKLYRYNPPWTLPFQRTNEVVVPVLNFPKEEAKKESS